MQYDLTGTDPNYKTEDRRFMVFNANQIIELDEPVYANSLKVYLVENTGVTELTQGTDWHIREEDHDISAISDAKVQDSSFDALLVKSFVMIRPYNGTQYEISVEYQRLLDTYMSLAQREGVPEEYDPNLMAEVLNSINYLEKVCNPVKNIVADLVSSIRILDEDLTGMDPDNWITGERHQLDVPNGKQVIRPGCGSYYKHDLEIRLVADGTVLQEGTDYYIIGANLAKTRVCEHPSGVYDYIYVVTSIFGEVEIDYHAFGGDIAAVDFDEMKNQLVAIARFLEDGRIITEDALPYHPTILDIEDRLKWIEDWIRAIDLSIPTITFDIEPPDNDIHWYTIATMYKRKDPNSSYIYIRDDFHFRGRLKKTGSLFDIMGSVDLSRPHEKFDSRVIVANNMGEKVPIDGYGTLKEPVVPQLRIVAVQKNTGINDGFDSGVALQLGVALHGVSPLKETIIIENHSGGSSDWFLREKTDAVWAAEDDNIIMPDNSTVWVEGSTDPLAYEERRVIEPDDGTLIWAGGVMFNDCKYPLPSKTLNSSIAFLKDYSLSQIKSLRAVVVNRNTGKTFEVYSDHNSMNPVFFFVVDYIHTTGMTLWLSEDGDKLRMSMLTTSDKPSEVNETFMLLQLYAIFNDEQ